MRASAGLGDEASAIADRLVELRAAAGIDAVRPPAVVTPSETDDTVTAATLRADEAFASLAFTEARRELDVAFHLCDLGLATSRDELVALWLLGAMLHTALGEGALADDDVRNALALDASLAVDPARYPPTLGARVDALRDSVAACPVAIALDPADAVLRIDGGGPSSAAPDRLACGSHWLTVSRPGYVSSTLRVRAEPGEEPTPIRVTLLIDPARALATPSAAGDPVPPIVELGASALGRRLSVLDLVREEGGALRATLGLRGIHVDGASTPDQIARSLLAPIDRGPDTTLIIGVSVGAGAVVAAAIAIGLGVALAPSSPPGWIGVGEVVRP